MWRRVVHVVAGSFRYKLLVLVLFPLLVVVPATIGFEFYWSRDFTYDQLFRKVNTDLSVADDIFRRLQRDYLTALQSLGHSYAFRTAFAKQDGAGVIAELQSWKDSTGFEFLEITDPGGRALLGRNQGKEVARRSSLFVDALTTGDPMVGVELYGNADLDRLDPELAARIRLPLIDTQRAAPTDRTYEDRAIVVRALVPIRDAQGATVAILDGGVLLNGNFAFVDAIRDLVYGPGSLAHGSIGTVTVFLDDVRISTNVPRKAGERALGTRVSKKVREQVLEHGEIWLDRAFVVNDWYISAYEPITDVDGRRIGMLYAGYLETPYRNAYLKAIAALGFLLALGIGLGVFFAIKGAQSISQPIEAIAEVVRATQVGRESRIGPLSSRDEIGELARQFDNMLELLEDRAAQIKVAADVLEVKVEERTRELRDKNKKLQETIDLLRQTQRQLVAAEKLAALGELAAGMAHEINNPVAVMLGNLEVMKLELGRKLDPVRTEVDLVIEQVDRIRGIVDRLLRSSRPSDYAGFMERVELKSVVEDTLVLVRHEITRRRVTIETCFAATRTISIDPQELQQVLVNLLVNAIQASPKKDVVRVSTADWQDNSVVIKVENNGPGIPEHQLKHVFDPFFTTKKDRGTGLGLSVSYGLIRRYGGNIVASSPPGSPTVFSVYLHQDVVFKEDEEVFMRNCSEIDERESVS